MRVTAGKLCLDTPIFKGGSAGGFGGHDALSSLFGAAQVIRAQVGAQWRGRRLVRGPGPPEAARAPAAHPSLVIVLLAAQENCSLGGILNIHLIYSPRLPTAL